MGLSVHPYEVVLVASLRSETGMVGMAMSEICWLKQHFFFFSWAQKLLRMFCRHRRKNYLSGRGGILDERKA